jgi:tetratricopeptide (TPR) repeat protein
MVPDLKAQRAGLMCLMLGLTTLALYWPATHFEFVDYDDKSYILENPAIRRGVTSAAVEWAFTSFYENNWHPVTWISDMIDCQLYGLKPRGHHLTNLMLHAANTALLFLLLWRMTGAAWRSALVAALFGWHPLHVESVAWVSERKDVLSTFFWLLSALAYVRYVEIKNGEEEEPERRKRWWHYGAALGFFALGLMSKPMVVTLPFVLLLLDYWPLGRIAGCRARKAERWGWLVLEKAPFLALALLGSAATYWVQASTHAVIGTATVPVAARIANVLVSYVRYLGKLAWPVGLAPYYPYPDGWSAAAVAGSCVLLAGISLAVFALMRAQPWLATGWLWFLGMLVPAIGLVQVGTQAMADRYSYLPSVGIFIMVAWGAAAWARRGSAIRLMLSVSAATVLAALAVCTRHQMAYWRDSVALFEHALAVTRDNSVDEGDLAVAFDLKGDKDQAEVHYLRALAARPVRGESANNARFAAHYNLGVIYLGEGKFKDAETRFRLTLEEHHDFLILRMRYGDALRAMGRFPEAAEQYRAATGFDPGYAPAWQRLGEALAGAGRGGEALDALREGVQLAPESPAALSALAWFLATTPDPALRNGSGALQLAQHACSLTGWRDPHALAAMDASYAETGQFSEALTAADQTRKAAEDAGLKDMAGDALARMDLYREGKCHRGP